MNSYFIIDAAIQTITTAAAVVLLSSLSFSSSLTQLLVVVVLVVAAATQVATTATATTPLCSSSLSLSTMADAYVHKGFCAGRILIENVSDNDRFRQIISIGSDRFITLNRYTASVLYVYKVTRETPDDVQWSSKVLVTAPSLNHGIYLHNNSLYASSDSTVYRWNYTNDDTSNFTTISSSPEVLIYNINSDGKGGPSVSAHVSRTMIIDSNNRLYVQVGQASPTLDEDSFRARIRRFILQPPFPIDYLTGEVFVEGVRNTVGLAFDKDEVLWGVDNGADLLYREDLGFFEFENNPACELNKFDTVGGHFGYPYCFTEYSLSSDDGSEKGQVWAWPTFWEAGTITDEQCRTDYTKPALALQGHSAPLGITFYKWKNSTERPAHCASVLGFPKEMDGYAFMAFHGSWNKVVPTGYKVVYLPIPINDPAHDEPIDLLSHKPPNAKWENGFRPVDVSFDECGRLLVSSDGTYDANTLNNNGAFIVRIDSTNETLQESHPTVEKETCVPNVGGPCCACRSNKRRADNNSSDNDNDDGETDGLVMRQKLFFGTYCRSKCRPIREFRRNPTRFGWECGEC